VNGVLAEWNLKPVCFGKPACQSLLPVLGKGLMFCIAAGGAFGLVF
jgi:hypothetical protein